ncbi:MAG: hypothetical protein QOG79_5317 [Mycobacterium sp.]|jgi:uncharacterized protein YjdB|nr:hypothetical protein [Pseudonocardiales bacterium]MDT5084476.1 hypothetical protein [Mycobacterium sp.]MDT5194598.1 hypothetical protein [Mycobacterium sp.]MDT5239485.1 hypothetical protein [Mycobacterium sp.]MDT5288410.1 hypothetical protein [Mycobacterium sp.]
MTTLWTDDLDSESAEYDDSENLWGDSDADSDIDSEDLDAEARADRRRRTKVRARQVALARRRQATARSRNVARRAPSAVTPQKATAAAVRTLDLETKVQEDTFRNAIAAQNKRMSRGEYAAVVGVAVNQFIETFQAPDNVYAKAALRFSPLLLLAPPNRGRGIEGLIKDPRVIGAAAIAGLVFVGDERNKKKKVKEVKIFAPTSIAKQGTATLVADVLDGDGRSIANEKVTWASLDTTQATIDPSTGALNATNKGGTVVITATAAEVVGRHFLTVT